MKQDYQKDWPDVNIGFLILSCPKQFVVFLDPENDLDWKTSDSYDKKMSNEERKSLDKITTRLSGLEHFFRPNLSKEIIIEFKKQLGEALALALNKNYEQAEKMLNLAEEYIHDRQIETSRYLFLKGSLIAGFVVVCIILLIFAKHSSLSTDSFYSILALLLGGLGALFSVILRMGYSFPNYNASKKLHYLEGGCRIIAGILSSLFIILCIKSKVLLFLINHDNTDYHILLLCGFIAGASERLAPSLLTKLPFNYKTLGDNL